MQPYRAVSDFIQSISAIIPSAETMMDFAGAMSDFHLQISKGPNFTVCHVSAPVLNLRFFCLTMSLAIENPIQVMVHFELLNLVPT